MQLNSSKVTMSALKFQVSKPVFSVEYQRNQIPVLLSVFRAWLEHKEKSLLLPKNKSDALFYGGVIFSALLLFPDYTMSCVCSTWLSILPFFGWKSHWWYFHFLYFLCITVVENYFKKSYFTTWRVKRANFTYQKYWNFRAKIPP